VYYIHTDHLNTPRRITSSSTNAIVWRWDSDPFGTAAANQNPSGNGTQFVYNPRFPGQYYDAETGLNYNYARGYDSAIGRYVESDPIGLNGGSYSTYAYVRGNPVKGVDPLGLDPLCNVRQLAQSYLNASGGNIDAAEDQAMMDRARMNWDATTAYGDLLRDTENYLTAYQYVADSPLGPDLAEIAEVSVLTPGWHGFRVIQNALGKELQSPASWDAMVAGWAGAGDAYDTIALGLSNDDSPCGCNQ
jgi:RHS repeat-associated protein